MCVNGNMCVWDNEEICASDMPPSCLCFAEMSIYFRFGEFRANSICPIFRQGHAKFLYDFDACMHFVYNPFACYTVHAVGHEGEWMEGGAIHAIRGDGHACK